MGIYERVTGKGFPATKPDFIPDAMWHMLRELSKHSNGDFWWPVAEQNEVEFDFINPVTGTTIFHAGPQKTYWLTKWMDTDSYEEYRKSLGKKWWFLPAFFPGNTRTPPLANRNVMKYKINGKEYELW